MKKLSLILIGIVFLALTACSTQNEEKEIEGGNKDTVDEQEQVKEPVNNEEEAGKHEEELDVNTSDKQDSQEALINFPEYETIKNNADIEELQYTIETDNPNTRVIIFNTADSIKKYKTVFVKRENRLKIINLENHEQIYNQIIK